VAQHLLDVNALIALGWSAHHHHDTMVAWFNRQAQAGWAGFVRVLSQPAVSGTASTVVELTRSLERNLAHPQHRLLALDFDFAEVLARCSGGVVGHRQVSDAYLLTAAMRAGMKLLTFDSGVNMLLASGAERAAHIELLR
jgi:hypothetical protein